jgi:alpha-1,6-mannosyltransferase
VLWRLLRAGRWRFAFLGAILGILPWTLSLSWFWWRDGVHKLAPVEMVAFARSAEFLPRIVEWLAPETAQMNTIYLVPFAIFVVVLILRRKNFSRFGEDVCLGLFAISPAVHAWYFTWAIPFSAATGNLAFRVAGITVGIYFILEHRQALGPSLWRLNGVEWGGMWFPILAAFAYSRWRGHVARKTGHQHPPEAETSRTG